MRFVNYQEISSRTAIYPDMFTYVARFAEHHKDEFVMFADFIGKIDSKGWAPKIPNFYYPALGLAGEAGEIANKIKKIMRDDQGTVSPEKKADLMDELGDILWYIAALATELDMNLGEIAARNIDKLASRQVRGTLGGSGDDR